VADLGVRDVGDQASALFEVFSGKGGVETARCCTCPSAPSS
jgi:hypothetical protein